MEELSQLVEPWQLTLRQLSSGKLNIQVRFRVLGDTLLTNERWDGALLGTGATARDYVTVSGNNSPRNVYWQGAEFTGNRLAIAPANSECEFHTPLGSDHWVLLVPRTRFTRYFGIESETELVPGAGYLVPEPAAVLRFSGLCNRILDGTLPASLAAEPETLRDELLNHLADLQPTTHSHWDDKKGRYLILRRALEAVDAYPELAGAEQLADTVGVSQRVLELSFRQHLGTSPHRYLKLCRLNRLHRALRELQPELSSVTAVMKQHGMDELGRTAGEFRALFDELPSETLRQRAPSRSTSFLEHVAETGLSRGP